MPYQITWEMRGVYRRYFGRLTDDEFVQAVREVEGSPRFYDIRYAILDFLDLEEFVIGDPSFLDVTAELNAEAAQHNPNIKVAVVAVSPVVLKLAEAYQAHRPQAVCHASVFHPGSGKSLAGRGGSAEI